MTSGTPQARMICWRMISLTANRFRIPSGEQTQRFSNHTKTTMKRRLVLAGGLLMLVPNPVFATTTRSFPKRNVSGKIVDINKRHGIIVLADFKEWDREQMKLAHEDAKPAIQHWLDGIDPKHAAIFLKPGDVEKLKKGDRIQITEYSYVLGNAVQVARKGYVTPLYDKLEVSAK